MAIPFAQQALLTSDSACGHQRVPDSQEFPASRDKMPQRARSLCQPNKVELGIWVGVPHPVLVMLGHRGERSSVAHTVAFPAGPCLKKRIQAPRCIPAGIKVQGGPLVLDFWPPATICVWMSVCVCVSVACLRDTSGKCGWLPFVLLGYMDVYAVH